MNRIPILEKEAVTPAVASLYDAVQAKLGLVPNMVKALGNSETALKSYLALSGAVGESTLSAPLREKIALLAAEENGCDYCLSAHTAIGGVMKISSEELEQARQGVARESKEQAVLRLTQSIIETRGAVSEEDYNAAVFAGVTDGEVAEIAALVALNIFTNYFNRLARTDIDFPLVTSGKDTVVA